MDVNEIIIEEITTTEEINKRGQELTELLNKSGIEWDSATMYGLVACAVSAISASSETLKQYQKGIMELARMLGDWSADVMEQRFGPEVTELNHVIEATGSAPKH